MVAAEQMARDCGETRIAWLLARLPDPPRSRLLRPKQKGSHRDCAMLSSPQWVAAATAYVKDVNAVLAIRQEVSKRAPKDDDPPQKTPTKKPPKAKTGP